MTQIEDFFSSLPAWVYITSLAVLGGLLILVLLRHRTGPFGGIHSLARTHHREQNGPWYMSERRLCSHFYSRYHHYVHPDEFRKATSYLSKVGELGRRELPWYAWAIIFVFILVEALSFGLQLTEFIAPNGSTNVQTTIGYLLAFVLACLLLFLTHTTGRELHHQSLLKRARMGFEKNPADKERLPIHDVPLEDDGIDDHEPPHIRLAARINHNPSLRASIALPVVTAALVLAIGIMQLYVRAQLIDQNFTQQTTETAGAGTAAPGSGSSSNDDAAVLLPNVTTAHTPEEERELSEHRRVATLAAFWLLFAIFLAVQLVGVVAGMRYGFAGRHSAAAARKRAGFSDIDAYMRYYKRETDPIALKAEHSLLKLQDKMRANAARKAEKAEKAAREKGDADGKEGEKPPAKPPEDFDKDISQRTFGSYIKEQEDKQRKEHEEAKQRLKIAPPPPKPPADGPAPPPAGKPDLKTVPPRKQA
jgi:hypothetical protein